MASHSEKHRHRRESHARPLSSRSSSDGTPVPLSMYLAEHPNVQVFPSTSEAAAKVVMISVYALMIVTLVFVALRAVGVVS